MAGYTEGWSSTDGDLVAAVLFEQEYNNISAAFDAAGGHKHTGLVGEGAYIPVIHNDLNEVDCNIALDQIDFFTNVGASKTLQLSVTDGALLPALTNDIDIGSLALKMKGMYAELADVTALTVNSYVITDVLNESTMVSNSPTALATQQSIKAFVESTVIDGGAF